MLHLASHIKSELAAVLIASAVPAAASVLSDRIWPWWVAAAFGGAFVGVAAVRGTGTSADLCWRFALSLVFGLGIAPGVVYLVFAPPLVPELVGLVTMVCGFSGYAVARFANKGLDEQLPWAFRWLIERFSGVKVPPGDKP